MKTNLRQSIALCGAVCLAYVLNCQSVWAADAVVADLQSSYEEETGTLLVSGSAPGADAVAITVLDNQDNLIMFGSALVRNDTFSFDTSNLPDSDPIWVSLSPGEYQVKVVDYAGGNYTEDNLTIVTEIEEPEPETLQPIETPTLESDADSILLTGTGLDTGIIIAVICFITISYGASLLVKQKYISRKN
ncbi:MAG TPA: hypothetical protein PKL83_00480 [bacterium]|nr:hypothetical protein [bacterium]